MTLRFVAQEILYPCSIFLLEQVDNYRIAQPIENMPDFRVTPAQIISIYPSIVFCPSANDRLVTEQTEKVLSDALFIGSCNSTAVDGIQVFLANGQPSAGYPVWRMKQIFKDPSVHRLTGNHFTA